MKKLFLLLIPITLLTLCGCSDDTISQRVYDLENTQYMILQRIEVIEIDQIDKKYSRYLNSWRRYKYQTRQSYILSSKKRYKIVR